jgi:hypothetical protein
VRGGILSLEGNRENSSVVFPICVAECHLEVLKDTEEFQVREKNSRNTINIDSTELCKLGSYIHDSL